MGQAWTSLVLACARRPGEIQDGGTFTGQGALVPDPARCLRTKHPKNAAFSSSMSSGSASAAATHSCMAGSSPPRV